MRTETYTVTVNFYTFEELNKQAKEAVRKLYSDSYMEDCFYDDWMDAIKEDFPNSELKLQYDFSYCQGSGVNLYGVLNFNDLLTKKEFTDKFSNKEIRFLEWAIDDSGIDTYTLDENYHYNYCICNGYDYVEDIDNELIYLGRKNIKTDILNKFSDAVGEYLSDYCRNIYKDGDYWCMCEFDDTEVKDWCDANNYEFSESGVLM